MDSSDFIVSPIADIVSHLKPVQGKGWNTPVLDLSAMSESMDLAREASRSLETSLNCCPNLEFIDTSSIPDVVTNLTPDGVMLSKGAWATGLSDTRNYLCHAELIWQLKATHDEDSFYDLDRSGGETEDTEAHVEMVTARRGQLIELVGHVLALQHRTCLWVVSLAGNLARISRWDRAGTIVSESFNYLETNWLAEFLWRYSCASRADRGFDDTVQLASGAEATKLTAAVNHYLSDILGSEGPGIAEHRDRLKKTLDDNYPTYKIRILDSAKKTTSFYIVRRPFSSVLSPCGRATRGYMAWGVTEQKLVFLKDTWRSDASGVLTEGQVYMILHELKVPHIPNVFASGDVYNRSDMKLQATLTNEVAVRLHCIAQIHRYVHHRVAQELALPLSLIKNSRQLVQAIRNVLQVIKSAYMGGRAFDRDIQHILHRDISSGNVMLNEKLEGILSDWDHAIELPLSQEFHRCRTGTWKFMSIDNLKDPYKLHAITDDIESCFWLLLSLASRFFPGGLDETDILFEEARIAKAEDGRRLPFGGLRKAEFIARRQYRSLTFGSESLAKVIHDFGSLLSRVHHLAEGRAFDPEGEEKYQTILKTVEGVDDIIKIFDDALASECWPQADRITGAQPTAAPATDGGAPTVDAESFSSNSTDRAAAIELPPLRFLLSNRPIGPQAMTGRKRKRSDHEILDATPDPDCAKKKMRKTKAIPSVGPVDRRVTRSMTRKATQESLLRGPQTRSRTKTQSMDRDTTKQRR